MSLQITGHHITITDKQRNYIEKKLPRLAKLVPRVDEVAFILRHEKKVNIAEINFRAGTISTFTKATDEDLMAAIDMAVDTAALQIKKAREKRGSSRKHGAPTVRRPKPVEEVDDEE